MAPLRWRDVVLRDCDLSNVAARESADFRGVSLRNCLMRGSSLESVIGVESLAGLTMPWNDVLASASALASAAGILIEQ